DRANVDVRLGPLKFLFCHVNLSKEQCLCLGFTSALGCWFTPHRATGWRRVADFAKLLLKT
ncbi:MAG: hypothetical protein KJZ76_08205, partial [Burkholderiaceae bacterium]|nr:hypothetical protein [Burkholderiaceae bacterium]